MNTDLFSDISVTGQSAILIVRTRESRWEALQRQIEELLGPLVDRRTIRDRRQFRRANPGRRCTD
jgi:hypothetical protein